MDKKNKKFIAFSQMMFMYKFNLQNLNEIIGLDQDDKKKIYNINAKIKRFKI